MSSPEAQKILAEAEKAKQERIERENQEALEQRMQEEEERAREQLDAQVRQDQEDEAAYDAFVAAQQQGGADRPPPTLHVGGTTFTWSGHPDANVRSPPEPTAQENAVQQLLEESERTTQEMINNRKVAIAVQKVVEREMERIRGVIEGSIDFGPHAIQDAKRELDDLKTKRGNAYHIYHAALDACLLETKEDPDYLDVRYDRRHGSGRIISRKYYVWLESKARKHCKDVANNTAGANAMQYNDRIRELEEVWRKASYWGNLFQVLADKLEASIQDDFITQGEQRKIYALIEEASNLITDAVQAGIKTNFAGIDLLNRLQLSALEAIQAQEQAHVVKAIEAAKEQEEIQGPAEPAPIPTALVEIGKLGTALPAALESIAPAFRAALWPTREELLAYMQTLQSVQLELARQDLTGRLGDQGAPSGDAA